MNGYIKTMPRSSTLEKQIQAAEQFSYHDYLLLPDDKHYEILGGKLMMCPAPSVDHQRLVRCLSHRLTQFVEDHHLGEILFAPCDVVLSLYDVVQPDILFISTARRSIVKKKNVQGAPDLIVEILSEGTEERDRREKSALYERHGVLEYWIVAPETQTIELYRRKGRFLKLLSTFQTPKSLTSPLLAGFKLPLQEIFTFPFS